MKRYYLPVGITILILIACNSCNQQSDTLVLKGPYIGQQPPGTIPEVFEPDYVSTGLDELNSIFSPNGTEFYFCVRNYTGAVSIFQMKMEGETWSQPALLPFASRFGDIDVTISPDGNTLLFSSRRPLPGSEQPKEDYDFWMVNRMNGSWDSPIHLGDSINSNSHDFYPMMANSRTIYFSSQREGPGTNNIYKSEWVNGEYSTAVKLNEAINTEHREFDPYVSPDERILIFASSRPGGFGASDLYISFKDAEGNWTTAQNMGSAINSNGSEYCPMVSPDGNFFFFTSARMNPRRTPDKPLSYNEFMTHHNSSGNGYSDIYWVSSKIIDDIKNQIINQRTP